MTDRIVHICNGDVTADGLSLADLPGDIRVWADALDQGPLLPLDREAFREQRAKFAAAAGWMASEEAARKQLAAWEQSLELNGALAEVVLWYEHDLFDQLALCRILYLLATPAAAASGAAAETLFDRGVQLTMVSIDRHPEVPHFLGMGQLQPEQLAQLWPRRTPIAKEALEEAVATWIAVTAADPRVLVFLMRRVKALPFLAGAIERHLEELPDVASGLSRSERQVLAAVGRGVGNPAAVMQEVQAIDPRYPMTDVLLRAVLETLTRSGLVGKAEAGYEILPLGRQALAGAVDIVAEVGVDRWRGGVHLHGRGPVWRWDSASRRLLLR
jgi:hypothetical protein